MYDDRRQGRGKGLAIQDAVRVKSAEFWIKLGEPVQALSELQRLPRRLWAHPSVRMVLRMLCRAR